VHELCELVRQLSDLSVHRTSVAAVRPRKLTLRDLHTTPQVSFPKSQRGDFDRLSDVDFAFELRRKCASGRCFGGQVSRQVRSRMLPRFEHSEDRSVVGVIKVAGGEFGARCFFWKSDQ
jgi:hypothetical protein